MNSAQITREIVDALLQNAFDLAYQDGEGDGEVDVADVFAAVEKTYSVATVKKMMGVTGAESVMEMILMYLDGRTQAKI